MKYHQDDKPFPLQRYYLLYAGIGAGIFYAILFAFFIHAEGWPLSDQYVENLTAKARTLYRHIHRNFLKVQQISLAAISTATQSPSREVAQ